MPTMNDDTALGPLEENPTFRDVLRGCGGGEHWEYLETRRFLCRVQRNIRTLAADYKLPQIIIVRECFALGLRVMRALPAVNTIQHHYIEISRFGNCRYELHTLENWPFDLRCTEWVRWAGRFPRCDKTGLKAIAEALGLRQSIVFQIALMWPLTYYGVCPAEDHNFYIRTLERFMIELHGRCRIAQEMLERCKGNQAGKEPEPRLDFDRLKQLA